VIAPAQREDEVAVTAFFRARRLCLLPGVEPTLGAAAGQILPS